MHCTFGWNLTLTFSCKIMWWIKKIANKNATNATIITTEVIIIPDHSSEKLFIFAHSTKFFHVSKYRIGKTHLQSRKINIIFISLSGWWIWFLQIFLQFHCCPWLCNKIGLLDDICYHYVQNVKCKMHPISKKNLCKKCSNF